MNCSNSFSFSTNGQGNFLPPDVKTWLSGTEQFWVFDKVLTSTFEITGFKNINIHGGKVVGIVTSLNSAALGGAIVEDWGVSIKLNGQIPLVSARSTGVNDWSITTDGPNSNIFEVSKFNTCFEFSSPFQSVRNIQLTNFRASGNGGQTVNNVNIYWNFNFIFYYSYEGE